MDIKYMKLLNDNKSGVSATGIIKHLRPISIDEIVMLESAYNSGNPFPAALRELLFLAGGYCYVLDYGLNESQMEMQEESRRYLTFLGRTRVISRPFYVIDVYNSGDQFLFVFLDEGKDNPTVYEAFLDGDIDDKNRWIDTLDISLTSLIDNRIGRFLDYGNPF